MLAKNEKKKNTLIIPKEFDMTICLGVIVGMYNILEEHNKKLTISIERKNKKNIEIELGEILSILRNVAWSQCPEHLRKEFMGLNANNKNKDMNYVG